MDEYEASIKHEASLSTCVDENYRRLYSNILGVNSYPNIQEVEQAHIHFIVNDHSSNDVIDIVSLARLYFIDYNFYCQKNISILRKKIYP